MTDFGNIDEVYVAPAEYDRLRSELAAKDSIIATLNERSAQYERDSAAKDARIAELADKGTLQALRDANDRAERAEAERDALRAGSHHMNEYMSQALEQRKEYLIRAEKAEAERDALREVVQFVADFAITDCSDAEVAEDSLHEIRKRARAALKCEIDRPSP